MKFSTRFVNQGVITTDSQMRNLAPPLPLELLDLLLADGVALDTGQSCQSTFEDENGIHTVILRCIGQESNAEGDQYDYPKINNPELIDRYYHLSVDYPDIDSKLFAAANDDNDPPVVAVEGVISLKDGESIDLRHMYEAGALCGWQDMRNPVQVMQELQQYKVAQLRDRPDLITTIYVPEEPYWDIQYKDWQLIARQDEREKLPGFVRFFGKEPPHIDFSIRVALPTGLPLENENEYLLLKNIVEPFIEAFIRARKQKNSTI